MKRKITNNLSIDFTVQLRLNCFLGSKVLLPGVKAI